MVFTTGDASHSVTLFPCAFSGPSPFVSEVTKQPKVSTPPLEEDITNSPSTLMVMVLSPGPVWALLPAFSLNYEQACVAAHSLLHMGTVAMHTISSLPVVTASIHHVLILPLMGYFEDESLSFFCLSK
ncbi:hypothetical protein DSO57_1011615 [Entomophthora muscae]|uniref:Uncharacterized protein n=1 Tax=Entomophthora muscae TaxID=34485 RepID=A0ACC2UR17_9FUNG|nr:hypothetical protein DSO57_1011615 [Entomophthora muscae]